ncbi:MAG: glycoside hydrolase family 57 protein [Candidatus Omnitrophota bacterium]
MAQKTQVYLHILWHQHQPWYVGPGTSRAVMPWVRLHGIKDYYDMALLSETFDGWKQTINLVPSLLEQLTLYTDGKIDDDSWELSRKPAAELSSEEIIRVLERFFDGHYPQMVHPFARYDELYRQRGSSANEAAGRFTVQDLRDLQTWHNLAWFDPVWRDNRDYPLKSLIEKQRGFTEEEKRSVLDLQMEVLKKIIPLHRKLWQERKLELTCTPFYHPILPILCDSSIAAVSNSHDALPQPSFAFPEDAEWQIREGISYFEKILGAKPQGMWPSEGSVSDAACALMVKQGINFFATDEQILFRSTSADRKTIQNRAELFRLHRLATPNGGIDCVFRDHGLSDGIGFLYSGVPAESAAQEFIRHLKEIGNNWTGKQPPLVSVILDGENCWEFYPNDGRDFLRAMIEGVLKDSQIVPTTIPEYRRQFPAQPTLQSIFPGSWINHNFRIWIGHPEDNAAWHYLREAREALLGEESRLEPSAREEAWKMIHICEGSDWFWWYGDENHSVLDVLFDRLFREHLLRVYELIGAPAQEALQRPIKQPKAAEEGGGIFFSDPFLCGGYYRWAGARHYSSRKEGGAMHKAEDAGVEIFFGRCDGRLCFQVEFGEKTKIDHNAFVTLHLTKPSVMEVSVNPPQKGGYFHFAGGRMEASIDLKGLGIDPQRDLWFFLHIDAKKKQGFSLPQGGELHLQGYTANNASMYWFI